MPRSMSSPLGFRNKRKAWRRLAVEDGTAVGYIASFVLAEPPHASVRCIRSSIPARCDRL
ncbi:hypothetical protein AW27_003680 [Streptomyces sp. PCS3-D2]|uniref:hypothetical protein n=1 Tax=Streptomyces sp. PCS3-D2 TaxID=1460244 RepID=UPI000AECBE28|nr:hypothetical protein [Streptomyces sp. PCS3-D2]WKV70695.1 hypothetical protein AW27_003680 [Streptomyces sp. PCS3-D2]